MLPYKEKVIDTFPSISNPTSDIVASGDLVASRKTAYQASSRRISVTITSFAARSVLLGCSSSAHLFLCITSL